MLFGSDGRGTKLYDMPTTADQRIRELVSRFGIQFARYAVVKGTEIVPLNRLPHSEREITVYEVSYGSIRCIHDSTERTGVHVECRLESGSVSDSDSNSDSESKPSSSQPVPIQRSASSDFGVSPRIPSVF